MLISNDKHVDPQENKRSCIIKVILVSKNKSLTDSVLMLEDKNRSYRFKRTSVLSSEERGQFYHLIDVYVNVFVLLVHCSDVQE